MAGTSPDWTILLWGNAELNEIKWHNRDHMNAMYDRELNGVADMMRWEILYSNGGIVVDADSICLRPLDDALLNCEAFACWENEIARPGLIAAGYFGCEAGNVFVKQIVRDIAAEPSVTHDLAWKTVGPLRLTESYRKYGYSRLRIYPSTISFRATSPASPMRAATRSSPTSSGARPARATIRSTSRM